MKARQKDNALQVVRYCLNISDCRRVQILRFFGEEFESHNCHKLCDNCANEQPLSEKDMTSEANDILDLVRLLADNDRVTMNYAMEVFRGEILP